MPAKVGFTRTTKVIKQVIKCQRKTFLCQLIVVKNVRVVNLAFTHMIRLFETPCTTFGIIIENYMTYFIEVAICCNT